MSWKDRLLGAGRAVLSELSKAETTREQSALAMPASEAPAEDPQALYWDPFSIIDQMGFRERPSTITYATLETMVWKVPIIQAIIQTRLNQLSAFCSPQRHKFGTGFRVKMRDSQDKPSPADKKFIKQMENSILLSGSTDGDPRARDSFETFVRKVMRDSIVFDQATFEILYDRRDLPAEWYAVDAKTIRLANTNKLYPTDDMDQTHTVQIFDNVIINEFSRKEMAFEVRNPRTSIHNFGYGSPEIEMLISTITQLLWGVQYNSSFFSQGTVSKGVLNLVGSIPEKHLRAFRREWYQLISGVQNAWRTPVINADEVKWIPLNPNNRDMEFSSWMEFLIRVTSGVFSIDPIEVGFKYGNSGQSRSVFEGASRSKVVESKDKGLKPLLKFLSRTIDKYIIWPTNPNFTFEFVGLDPMTPKEMADLTTQRIRTMYTIDEMRAEEDLDPLPNGTGKVLLDASWMQMKREIDIRNEQQAAQAKSEAENEAQLAAVAGSMKEKISDEELKELAAALAALQGSSNPPVAPVPEKVPPTPKPAEPVPETSDKSLSLGLKRLDRLEKSTRGVRIEFEV